MTYLITFPLYENWSQLGTSHLTIITRTMFLSMRSSFKADSPAYRHSPSSKCESPERLCLKNLG